MSLSLILLCLVLGAVHLWVSRRRARLREWERELELAFQTEGRAELSLGRVL